MTGKTSAAVEAAMRQYQRAPEGVKPSDAELAKKHKVNKSTIYRARKRLQEKKAKEQSK